MNTRILRVFYGIGGAVNIFGTGARQTAYLRVFHQLGDFRYAFKITI